MNRGERKRPPIRKGKGDRDRQALITHLNGAVDWEGWTGGAAEVADAILARFTLKTRATGDAK